MAIRNKSTEQAPKLETKETIEPDTAVPEEVQTEATTDEKVAEATEEVEAPETEAPEEVAEVGWDEPEAEVEAPSSPDDFSWVSDLIGEVKTKDEVKAKISEYKSKLKEYEENPIAGVPEEFSEVIKVAKTGDWKDYLASQIIDYTQLDPVEEFERDFIQRAQNNPKYFTDGKYDHQKVVDTIDSLPEATRELHGAQILQAKSELQERQRAAIKAKAEAKRTEAEKSLAQSTKSLAEILPLEQYGIKFDQKHSSEIYEGIVNSKLTKKHLGMSYDDLVRSGADMKAVTRSITLAEKGEKMISYKSKASETKAKKEVLKSTQNIQLNTAGTNPTPEDPEVKIKSPAEKLRELRASQQKGLWF